MFLVPPTNKFVGWPMHTLTQTLTPHPILWVGDAHSNSTPNSHTIYFVFCARSFNDFFTQVEVVLGTRAVGAIRKNVFAL